MFQALSVLQLFNQVHKLYIKMWGFLSTFRKCNSQNPVIYQIFTTQPTVDRSPKEFPISAMYFSAILEAPFSSHSSIFNLSVLNLFYLKLHKFYIYTFGQVLSHSRSKPFFDRRKYDWVRSFCSTWSFSSFLIQVKLTSKTCLDERTCWAHMSRHVQVPIMWPLTMVTWPVPHISTVQQLIWVFRLKAMLHS